MYLNYDKFLFGDESLISTVIGPPSQAEKQRIADSLQSKIFYESAATNSEVFSVQPARHPEEADLPPPPQNKLFQFDESFLQMINEWQRRNAAGTSNPDKDHESEGENGPGLSSNGHSACLSRSSSAATSPRTLLSIASKKAVLNKRSTVEGENPCPSNQNSPQRNLSELLAKTIIRDRSGTGLDFATTPPASPYVTRALATSQIQTNPVSTAPTSPRPFYVTSPPPPSSSLSSPPWAAAMASISVSSALRHRPFVDTAPMDNKPTQP